MCPAQAVEPPTIVIVPVRNRFDLTERFVEDMRVEEGLHHLFVLDNGSTDRTRDYLSRIERLDPRVEWVDTVGLGIYEMWDYGVQQASYQTWGDPFNVVIANNDVQWEPGILHSLAGSLRAADDRWIAYPDYDATGPGEKRSRETRGTYRHGGMLGAFFMLRGEKFLNWIPLIDPKFQWWCGDDDLAFNVEERGGKQVRVEGLPITHLNEQTAREYPELAEMKVADMDYCMEKWGK